MCFAAVSTSWKNIRKTKDIATGINIDKTKFHATALPNLFIGYKYAVFRYVQTGYQQDISGRNGFPGRFRQTPRSAFQSGIAPISVFLIPHLQNIKKKEKTHSNTRVRLFTLVRPAGFEPVAYRVGVIRRSNGKPLQANSFVGFGQICRELQKIPGGIAVQCLRGFLR